MTDGKAARPFEILLVEDSPDDAELTSEALKEGRIFHNLHVVSDGIQALDFVHQRGEYASSPQPDIILLDLDLPRMDGRAVLSEIKAEESLKHIPVVVLTASKVEEDILKSYRLHANCYVTKPIDMNQFIDIIRSLENFWLTVVRLPSLSGNG